MLCVVLVLNQRSLQGTGSEWLFRPVTLLLAALTGPDRSGFQPALRFENSFFFWSFLIYLFEGDWPRTATCGNTLPPSLPIPLVEAPFTPSFERVSVTTVLLPCAGPLQR